MKKTIYFLSFSLALLFALPTTQAQQNYQSAVGARLGSPLSASYKTFLNESNAVEIYAGARWRSTYSWFSIAGAYQIHKPIQEVDGLNWYFGGGAAVLFYSFDTDFTGDRGTSTTLGLQGYLGLDYTFRDVPINLTLDWVPTILLSGFDSGFGPGFGSLGVRYILSE